MLLHIFLGCVIFFLHSLIYKKLIITVYSKYKFCVTIHTTIQRFRVSNFFSLLFFKENNTFIQQGCVKWIKSDSKDLYC